MGNTRYQLNPGVRENSNLKLLYVTESRYEGDWPSIKHTHYFAELFYVRAGNGNFLVEDRSFPIAKDDLIIINPNIEHTEISFESTPLEYVSLGVEGLSFTFRDLENYTIFNCRSNKNNLTFYFTSMLAELENKEKDYELICQDLLEILIIHLLRTTGYTFELTPSLKASRECSAVKRYIDANYAEDITLDTLSEMAHLNKYYFVHTFTKAYGLSPISYLNERRLQASKELLQSTNHSISEVARLSGFSSQSYYAQSFKKSCNMSPGNYRKTTKKK